MTTISRTDWGRQHHFCWLCGIAAGWCNGRTVELQTHELVGAAMKAKAMTTPATWFRACQFCHPQLSSTPKPELLTKLLSIKQHYDPENYSLIEVLKLYRPNRRGGWSDGPVTQSEVDAMAEVIFGNTRNQQ